MIRIPHAPLVALLVAGFACSFTGCRNRCNNPCGGGLFANNGTIAPAPTYSLNIPSAGQNQPYYRPNGGPISTTARAPTPATNNQNNNSNLQWRRSGEGSGNFGAQQPAAQPQNNPAAGTRLVELNSGVNTGSSVMVGGVQNPSRVATATQPLPATGVSFTDSRNFATTQIDERMDSTRVPVTDATQVRATAQTFIAAAPTQANPNFAGLRPQQGFNVQPQQTFAAQPVVRPVQTAYTANGYIVPSQPQRFAAQTFIQPNNTVSYSAAANNAVGWRGRELGSQAR